MLEWLQRVDVWCLLAEGQRADTTSQSVMRRSLTKTEIIRKKDDIDRIFKQGRRFSCEGMRLIALYNNLDFDRFIVIPAKHYGNSVERNLVRRRAKEIFRCWPGRLYKECSSSESSGLDLVLVVYPGRVSDFSLLESNFNSLLDRLNRK